MLNFVESLSKECNVLFKWTLSVDKPNILDLLVSKKRLWNWHQNMFLSFQVLINGESSQLSVWICGRLAAEDETLW